MPSDRATETAPFRQAIYRFGRFTFNGASQELWADGARRKLEAKPRTVLACLLAQPNFAVSKKDLVEAVWPGKKAVEPGSLLTAAYNLRTALEPDGAAIIETVPGIGYRLAVPVDVSFVDVAAPNLAGLAAGGQVPHREQWRLERPLSHRVTPPAGEPAKLPDVWLALNEKTREARVFKFATTQTRLDELKLEAAISSLLFARLGARRDLVPILEWNFKQPPYYIESRYGGEDLRAWFAAQGGINEIALARRLDMLAQIARSVGDAHGCGALHGDIKPGNVLVGTSAEGTPYTRLADFGAGALTAAARTEALAVTLREPTAPGGGSTKTGTFLYMAPEIMAGGQVTAASDIFALGTLLYQLVVGDFDRPLATGWEAQISDPVLRNIIAEAVAGDPARRTNAAASLAEAIEQLEHTRRRLAAEQAAARAAAIAAETMRRAEIRRPWVALAGLCLLVGAITSTIFAVKSARDGDAAHHQARLAQRVNEFLTIDLLSRTNPRVSGIADETLIQAAERAEADVSARFADDPEIAASIYAALASAFQARTAFGPARIASENGVRSYQSLEGPNSPHAAIMRLNRAAMEAYIHTPETLQTARAIVAQEERRLPELRARRAEVAMALHTAKGAIAMGVADGTTALAEFQAAQRLAATAPESLDADGRLRLRYREAQAQIMLYHYAEAAKAFADVATEELAQHGPRFADTLTTQMQEAEALGEVGDSERALQLINSIFPAMTEVLGTTHSSVLAALEVRGDARMALGRFDEAARDFQTLYDAASITGGANPMFVVDGLAELGHAKCRAGDTRTGLDTVARAASAAVLDFGARSSVAAGVATIEIECLIKAGQFAGARQALAVIDRDAANTVLPDGYAGETFDLYDAAVAHGLGDDPGARAHLARLLKFFAAGSGNAYYRRWAQDLAVVRAPAQN